VIVRWKLSNGYQIGSQWLRYNSGSDYRCLAPAGCSTGAYSGRGYIYLGISA
jgi:hypothetical protein